VCKPLYTTFLAFDESHATPSVEVFLTIYYSFQILLAEEDKSNDSLSDKILSFPGPVCTVSNLRASTSSKLRGMWTPAVVRDCMVDLERAGLGETVNKDRTVAFVKTPPNLTTTISLSQKTSISLEQYIESFLAQDLNLSKAKRDGIVQQARLAMEIQEYLTQNIVN